MKARIFFISLYILIITVIQSTVLDYVRFNGIKPNLLVVFIVCFSLVRGNMTEGAVVGLFAGLAHDVASGKELGLYALLGMFLGIILSSVNRRLYRDNVVVVVFFNFVAAGFYEAIVMLYIYIKQPFNLVDALRYNLLPVCIYNSLASIFFYFIVIRLNTRLEGYVKNARKY